MPKGMKIYKNVTIPTGKGVLIIDDIDFSGIMTIIDSGYSVSYIIIKAVYQDALLKLLSGTLRRTLSLSNENGKPVLRNVSTYAVNINISIISFIGVPVLEIM